MTELKVNYVAVNASHSTFSCFGQLEDLTLYLDTHKDCAIIAYSTFEEGEALAKIQECHRMGYKEV